MNDTGNPFREWIRLEQPRIGSRVTSVTDDFFAAAERMIAAHDPVFVPDGYDDHGKWMDGWESRRRRTPGHDACIVRLGVPGIVHGVDIDTSFFTGNYPPRASIDACHSDAEVPESGWFELLPEVELGPDAHHYHAIDGGDVVTHLRLNIFPDGGVARLRIYGEVRPDYAGMTGTVDLFALENGGRALLASDEHFGSMHNLNLPGRGVNMGDGWETARRRGPGNDWVIARLGHPGEIERVIVDTAYFKGNYPDRVAIDAAMVDGAFSPESASWRSLLPESKLGMDREHEFAAELSQVGPVSHLRMSIYPDGGVSRLRVYGRPVQS